MDKSKSAQCTVCEARVREMLNHALLQCTRFAAERQTMWAGLERVVGVQRVAQARALPEDQRLEALLGDAYWGLHAAGAAEAVDGYLAVQMRVRRAWVPPVAAGGVRAGRGSCAGERVVAATACQVCHMLTGAPTMVLCNGCDRGFLRGPRVQGRHACLIVVGRQIPSPCARQQSVQPLLYAWVPACCHQQSILGPILWLAWEP